MGQREGFSGVSEQLTICKDLEDVKPKDESLTIFLRFSRTFIFAFPHGSGIGKTDMIFWANSRYKIQ